MCRTGVPTPRSRYCCPSAGPRGRHQILGRASSTDFGISPSSVSHLHRAGTEIGGTRSGHPDPLMRSTDGRAQPTTPGSADQPHPRGNRPDARRVVLSHRPRTVPGRITAAVRAAGIHPQRLRDVPWPWPGWYTEAPHPPRTQSAVEVFFEDTGYPQTRFDEATLCAAGFPLGWATATCSRLLTATPRLLPQGTTGQRRWASR